MCKAPRGAECCTTADRGHACATSPRNAGGVDSRRIDAGASFCYLKRPFCTRWGNYMLVLQDGAVLARIVGAPAD